MSVIALYGGSFNPPHVSHQMIALLVLETRDVDEVWIAPALAHPFGKDLASFDDRLEMCRLLAAPLGSRVRVSDIERTVNNQAGRTLNTLEELARAKPDDSFRLVIGADILEEKDAWYRWDEVVALAPPIVISRRGHRELPGALPEVAVVSATEVRERLGRGESAIPLVPRSVMDYIATRGLYR
jgi:nicotinate-nucleotide adenylyltransferase